MAPNDHSFIPLATESNLKEQLNDYCSPLDAVANGPLDDRRIEQVQQNLREYLIGSDLRYQLPPDISSFAGRQVELETVMNRLKSVDEVDQVSSSTVFVISGRAGVGKSALALHAAHQLKHRFPDTQLYIDLHGSDGLALSPEAAIANLLSAWDEGDGWLPTTLDERLALYQTVLADKRGLIILDDADSVVQVAPLIPQAPRCAILITSRHRLAGLAMSDHLSLVDMEEDEGLSLLLQASGNDNVVSMDLEAAKQIVNLCGRNPLAIQIAACTLQHLPAQQRVTYATQLAAEQKKLALFNPSELTVRASFALSYQTLSESCAQLFRLLSLAANPTLTEAMAGMLLESTPAVAKAAISQLSERQLLKPIDQNRYQFQPLLRLIAKEKLAQTESSKQRQAVRLRIAQWYLKMAEEMALVFYPMTQSQLAQKIFEHSPQLPQEEAQTLRLSALTWFEAERSNLMACIDWADQAEAWDMVVQFAKHLVIFFSNGAYWQDWEQSHQLALEATRKLENQQLEAQILTNLGNAFLQQSQWEKATDHYEASLALLKQIGDRNGEAQTLLNMSVFYHRRQDDKTATRLREAADEIRFANASMPIAPPLEENPPVHQDALPIPVEINKVNSKRAPLLTAQDTYIVVGLMVAAMIVLTLIVIAL